MKWAAWRACASWSYPAARSGDARRSFLGDASGNLAMMFAIIAPTLLLVVGIGVDYGLALRHRERLQVAADAASIAAAKELAITDAMKQSVQSVVEAVVASTLAADLGSVAQGFEATSAVTDVSGEPLQVRVEVSSPYKSPLGSRLGIGSQKLRASSVATVIGKPSICVLALDPSAMGTIYLQKQAKVVGQSCAVYSNSTHPNGIKAFGSSTLIASMICSAGGKAGGKGNFTPDPITDCPQFDDPLASRPEPAVGACLASNLVIIDRSVTLSPGTYCGGLTIDGASVVTLKPGIYVIKDGPLTVAGTAQITGQHVGLYFHGAKASFTFQTDTTIDLSAPRSGTMAGLLFFGSRSQSGVDYKILSDHARNLLGTIYLPQGSLTIDANAPIADQSAYTAIVAQQLRANAGPTVVLNTNYDATDVPVPDSIRGVGQPVALSR